MMTTPIDEDIRQRIKTDLMSNLCVEAGAGTGKTTVLVSRIVEILRTGYAPIDKLAVITFTEKAAAELSVRVREGLEKALAENHDPKQADQIRTALRDLNRARIETLHAFASSLLRERPVEAGLDPNFEVLDALGSDLGFDEAYRSWLGKTLSKPSPVLWRAFNRGFDLSQIGDVAQLLHQHRSQLPLQFDNPPERAGHTLLAELAPAVNELRDLLHDCTDPTDRGAIQVTKILELFDDYQRIADRPEELDRMLLQPVKISAAGNKKNWKLGSSDRQKELCTEIKEKLQTAQVALRSDALVGILPLVESFVLDYSEQRRRAGTAEFDDLLIWTRDLLRDQPAIRQYFQQRFNCVLVDEFQDTDPLQVEIVMYLTSGDIDENDWRKLQPLPGKLFVVGDPKQSIYRFRRADITIYEWVKTKVLADGLLTIKQNFRSVPDVIGWINDLFAELIQATDGIQPQYTELVSARTNHHIPNPPVVLIRGEAKGADGVREEEARLLAGTIERIVREERWPVSDGDQERAVSWRDVAILLPSRTGIEYYEQALSERDISYRHDGGRSFFDRQEVRELINCLKAIDDPTDRLSLVAAMRSGAFGCSDEELFRFVDSRGVLDLRVEPDSAVPAVNEALATLRRLHGFRGQMTLPEFIGRVLDETRLIEYAITLPQGQQAAANLTKVADQARAFSGVRGGGLRAFVRWLSTSSSGRSDEADAAVAEARDDVVRILTIHSAKGLEFPIVALANLNSDRHKRSPFAIPDPNEQRLALSVGSKGNEFKTPGFDDHFEREKQHDDAEHLRLLYVAATRARDYLIVPAVLDEDKSKGMLKSLISCWSPSPDGTGTSANPDNMYVYDTNLISDRPLSFHRTDPVLPEEIDEQEARRDGWLKNREELLEQVSRGLSLTFLNEFDLWDDDSKEDDEEIGPRGPDDRFKALDRALHRVMARVDLGEARNLTGLIRRIAEQTELADGPDELIQLAQNCLACSATIRANSSQDIQREVVFSAHLADGGFAEGRVDLLFVDEGELVAVDFRTEEIKPDEIELRSNRYRAMAALTAFAIESGTGMRMKEVCYVFARAGVEQCIPIDEDVRALGRNPTHDIVANLRDRDL